MAEERQGGAAPEGGEPQVKVTDRRRFPPDGSRRTTPRRLPGAGAGRTRRPQRDAATRALAAQAARIDELSRAYAALVEDNKAFRQRLEREKAAVIEAERAACRAGAARGRRRPRARARRGLVERAKAGTTRSASLVDGVRLSLGGLHRRIAEFGRESASRWPASRSILTSPRRWTPSRSRPRRRTASWSRRSGPAGGSVIGSCDPPGSGSAASRRREWSAPPPARRAGRE